MKAQSMIVTTLENKLKRIKANMKKFDTICFAMLFVIIIMAGVMVWAFVYVPRFSANISENSADWGNFGQFFWGLGTMLFTALNVVVLLFVNKELRKYNDKQQEHQDKLKLQIEENRKQIQLEILRQKRIDNWLNNYYQLVLQLVNNRLNSDAEWLKILRNLTIIYKSMINDGLWGDKDNPQHLAYRIEALNSEIKNVIVESYSPEHDNDNEQVLFDMHFGLTISIVQLYFNMTSAKDVNYREDINYIYKRTNQ